MDSRPAMCESEWVELDKLRAENGKLRTQLTIAVAWCESNNLTPFWATVARKRLAIDENEQTGEPR